MVTPPAKCPHNPNIKSTNPSNDSKEKSKGNKKGHKHTWIEEEAHPNEDIVAEGTWHELEGDVHLVDEGDNVPPPDPLIEPFSLSPKK